jgi:hypothetical protein
MINIKFICILAMIFPALLLAQSNIIIDGNFDDWANVAAAVSDPVDDVHDTDGYPDGGMPAYREYSDVDILEVKFTNDAENLYGYIKATGQIGRTSSDTLGHTKNGRYYFIFTIDVDDNDTTGYQLKDGGYYPDSYGYDMNMEVEFYNGGFNTGHYINHEYLTQAHVDTQGIKDLEAGIVRLAPGTYDYYTQWVTFEDSSYVLVSDRGPVYQGIITIAVSEDGHEAEMKAPMWGFLRTPEGKRIIDVGQYIDVSASLEGSGELSEEAIELGHTPGSTSVWGSDTAEPFRFYVKDPATHLLADDMAESPYPTMPILKQNYPNPFNPHTSITFVLPNTQMISLEIFDLLGRKVATLVEGVMAAGEHTMQWTTKDGWGNSLPSGIYFAVLRGTGFEQARSMLYLK